MNIGFFAFTGTGNTLRVCNILANSLAEQDVQCDINMINDVKDASVVNKYDKIVIAHPVHGFNTPMIMLDFIKSMPKTNDKTVVYLVRVSGEALKLNDAAGIVPKRILKKKGYFVKGEFMYVMPYNIIFKHTDNMATRMKIAAERKSKKDALTILNNDLQLTKNNLFNRFVSFVCKLEHIAMPAFGKHYKATRNCTGCGLCVKSCPKNNISIKEEKVVFGNKCVGCMACCFNCPTDAITTYILNGWRVNGKYNFDSTPATDDEICNYCKKSYLKYFKDAES